MITGEALGETVGIGIPWGADGTGVSEINPGGWNVYIII